MVLHLFSADGKKGALGYEWRGALDGGRTLALPP